MDKKRRKQELLRIAGRQIRFDFPMSRRTTFRVGGNAEAVYEANDPEGLSRVVSFLFKEEIPCLVAGKGSNLLVRDGGIAGVVIFLAGAFADIQLEGSDYPDISAGAGLSISDLLIWCREKGLSGLEFLAGIPGSVGGAVAMNAGAFGKETGSRVREIRLVSRRGQLAVRDRSRLRFSYRDSNLEAGAIITNVLFRLDRHTPKTVSAQDRRLSQETKGDPTPRISKRRINIQKSAQRLCRQTYRAGGIEREENRRGHDLK